MLHAKNWRFIDRINRDLQIPNIAGLWALEGGIMSPTPLAAVYAGNHIHGSPSALRLITGREAQFTCLPI